MKQLCAVLLEEGVSNAAPLLPLVLVLPTVLLLLVNEGSGAGSLIAQCVAISISGIADLRQQEQRSEPPRSSQSSLIKEERAKLAQLRLREEELPTEDL